jgi:hypothetical protein
MHVFIMHDVCCPLHTCFVRNAFVILLIVNNDYLQLFVVLHHVFDPRSESSNKMSSAFFWRIKKFSDIVKFLTCQSSLSLSVSFMCVHVYVSFSLQKTLDHILTVSGVRITTRQLAKCD